MFVFCFVLFCFETGSLYIALAVLELSMYARLAYNSQVSVCLCFPSAGIKVMYHHVLPKNALILNSWVMVQY